MYYKRSRSCIGWWSKDGIERGVHSPPHLPRQASYTILSQSAADTGKAEWWSTSRDRCAVGDASSPEMVEIDDVPAETQPTSAASYFMILPVELRSNIYEHLLHDIFLRKQEKPWEPIPPHSRFTDYLSLLLTCRAVYEEAEALFRREYAHRTIFYFESVYPMYKFFRNMGNFPDPESVRFNLVYSKTQIMSRLGRELVR